MNNDSDNTEKRRLKRWQLFLYLRVFNQDTGSLLGYIVDLSESGMRLISDDPIPINKDFELWIDVPRENGPRQRVELKARSVWNNRDINPDFYDTGFHLIDMIPSESRKIRQVIESFKAEFKFSE